MAFGACWNLQFCLPCFQSHVTGLPPLAFSEHMREGVHVELWRWQSLKNNPSVVQPGGLQKRLSHQSSENRQVSELNKAHSWSPLTTSWKSEYKERVHVWAPWMGGWKRITLPKEGSSSLDGLCRHWTYQIRLWGQILLFIEPSGVWRRRKKIKGKSGDVEK